MRRPVEETNVPKFQKDGAGYSGYDHVSNKLWQGKALNRKCLYLKSKDRVLLCGRAPCRIPREDIQRVK